MHRGLASSKRNTLNFSTDAELQRWERSCRRSRMWELSLLSFYQARHDARRCQIDSHASLERESALLTPGISLCITRQGVSNVHLQHLDDLAADWPDLLASIATVQALSLDIASTSRNIRDRPPG